MDLRLTGGFLFYFFVFLCCNSLRHWLRARWTHAATRVVSWDFAAIIATRVRTTVRVRAGMCLCVNSRPPAHFTHRQTSKAVWINPACRGRSACHPQFHISATPAAPNLHAHSYWNEQMEFCHAANRHPSLREDKTSKEPRCIGICLQVVRLGAVAGEAEVFCVSVKVWAKCRYHVFLIKAGQLCFHYSPLAKAGSLSPWLDTAEMMSWSRARNHVHRYTHQSECSSPLLTPFLNP